MPQKPDRTKVASWFRDEPLHPELSQYLSEEVIPGVATIHCLRHPWVFSVPYDPIMNAMLNAQYEMKKTRLREAKEKKNWSQYIALYERPYRIQIFDSIQEELTDEEYWQLLSNVWIDSENIWQYPNINALIQSNRPKRECLMDDNEIKFIENLPEAITVYRGHQSCNEKGWSWTLSFHCASRFANRLSKGEEGIISQCHIDKKDIIAYISGRDEYEIIIDPTKHNIESYHFPSSDDYYQSLYQIANKQFILGQFSQHGCSHWRKVEDNAIKLCQYTPNADIEVCRHFAILHDCCRQNEFIDIHHGDRAAEFAKELHLQSKLSLNSTQMDLLNEALCGHNHIKNSDDPTIGVCWDADRLDLLRVSIIPETPYLSTIAAKQKLLFNI